MDEQNQQTVHLDSEAIPKDFDNDSSNKEPAEEESGQQLSIKSSGDTTSSEIVAESASLSTNGFDNESKKTNSKDESDNVTCEPSTNFESIQLQEDTSQTEKKSLVKSPTDNSIVEIDTVKEELEGDKNELSNSNEEKGECSVVNNINLVESQNVVLSNNENKAKDTDSLSEQAPEEGVNFGFESTLDLQDILQRQDGTKKTEEKDTLDLNENKSENISVENENKGCSGTEMQGVDKVVKTKTVSQDFEKVGSELPDISIEKNEELESGMDVAGDENIELNNEDDTKMILDENFSKASPKSVDLGMEIIDSQVDKKLEDDLSEEIEFKDKSDISDSEIAITEVEHANKDVGVQESPSNQSNINNSTEEENLNKSENDEVMDTEIVNCNEIEQIDLIEPELQKDKEVDRIRIEIDSKEESKVEELTNDILETEGEKLEVDKTQTEAIEDHIINEPGNSEEETITGDTTSQASSNLCKNTNEEVCIVPDNMTPRLPILPQNESQIRETREKNKEVVERSELRRTRDTKLRERSSYSERQKKEVKSNSKTRPVRNAAKLAGNKIKSLVENDLVPEEPVSSVGVEEDSGIQENADETSKICTQCKEVKSCKFIVVQGDQPQYLCSEQCSTAFKNAQVDTDVNDMDSTMGEFVRKCAQCHSRVTGDERCLLWETMDFCNEDCLGKYQTDLGSSCANCKGKVPLSSLGKYCVRFGYDVKQFCSAACLEEYKKGLKVCSYCQKDISTGAEGFLAPVGDKGQFKDFCTQSCMEKYEKISSNTPLPDVIEECAVCSNSKPVRVEVELDNKTHKLCSEPCFAAFKFVNNITEGQCDMCRKYFDRAKTGTLTLFFDDSSHSFCCKTCMNVYILANRKIVPCNWCKVKKYNFDMIKKVSANGQLTMMCSLNCLMLYQVSVNAVCSKNIKCDFCMTVTQPQYHLKMSDTSIRNFCSYNCVMSFQNMYPKQSLDVISGTDQLNSPIPTGGPKRATPRRAQVESSCVPVISSIQSLASPNGSASPSGRVQIPRADGNMVTQVTPPLAISSPVAAMPAPPPPQVYQQIITKPPPAKEMKNKSVLCKPYSHTKGVSCRPHPCMKETQTDQSLNRKFLIPIPVPIYVPVPMHMFATPFPVPVPFPLPVPVPIFIPTTRNSAKGIFKEIKKIQEKIPTDPFEAELLMMAEMVAGDKKQDPTDSESEDGNDGDDGGDGTFSPENVDTSNTFGDDMLQMALKMASELEEPAVDMESVLTSNTITTSTQPAVDPNKALYASDPDDPDQVQVMSMNRGRKRSVRGSRNSTGGTPSKRGRRTSGSVDVPLLPPPEPVPPPRIEVEKPDANMCLKYTFGVNAWRHWVMQKNAELEKAAMTNRKIKLFKPELLQLTADELNFSLCLFVKEVRKPNGTEYAPDTIYYLCLGIQQYLFENGRIDNIFTDSYYEKFTDCLDEVAKKFAALYNDSQYIVTRVEEEHLWESKQLGAHSPHVLLSTLMFFNTKHFNLVTVEEHMQLSFSHIMKHWKRNPNTPGVAKVPGSRNVLLRFYPPQSALEANSRKKKVYEQQENEENPLRCPVKLYEFYLSKCPESVKTRNDVFYLLPERSCVPDSPVWYSTMALGKEPLMKMLHRVKMVKEINIALLTC